jgi:Glycosyltransferase Family 4/Glycosyl transferases group 1
MTSEGNILVLTHWSFKDALVQTYTLPYVDIIRRVISPERKIFLITAEQQRIALSNEETGNINKEWAAKNMQLIPQPYKRFGWKKMIAATANLYKIYRLIKKEKIKTIHAFCTPAGSIAYILSKLTGVPLVVDSYEPHAGAMVETGAWKKNSISFKILFFLEKKLTGATHLIATTAGMKEYAKENYGVELKKLFVKPACINLQEFYPRKKDEELERKLGLNNKLVCVYAGKLGGTYLKDEVFQFVKSCYNYWKDDFRFLMLSSETNKEIADQIKKVSLPPEIVIKKYVEHAEIPGYLSLGDFALNPQVPVPSKKYGTPIKDGEYWAMGLPIVISPGISEDSDIIEKNAIGAVINLQERSNHAIAVKQIDDLLKKHSREELQDKIFEIAKKYRSFTIAERIYPLIYGN